MDGRLRRGGELVSLSRRCWRDRQDGGVKRKFTGIMCWRWCGREESPQALGSAGGYPLNCHQATGMMGERTRPRLLHERCQAAEVVAPSRFRSALEAQIGQLLSGRSCPSPGYVPADPRACGLSFLRLQLLIRAPLLLRLSSPCGGHAGTSTSGLP